MSQLGVYTTSDPSHAGFRPERSNSDAGVHAASRAHVRAAAGHGRYSPTPGQAHRLSPLRGQDYVHCGSGASLPRVRAGDQRQSCSPHRQQSVVVVVDDEHHRRCSPRQHHHKSHSCLPSQRIQDASGPSRLALTPNSTRSHSHSGVFQLASQGAPPARDMQPSPASSSRSRAVSSDEDEVTYVWKEGRVQVHHARDGASTPDISSSGQHVHYVWRNGNVERVITGSNHVSSQPTADC